MYTILVSHDSANFYILFCSFYLSQKKRMFLQLYEHYTSVQQVVMEILFYGIKQTESYISQLLPHRGLALGILLGGL
jgi:hypothetical protein